MHSFLSNKTSITTWFYTGCRKFLVLERKKLDMGVWTQLEMSLIGSNTVKDFLSFPTKSRLCSAFAYFYNLT